MLTPQEKNKILDRLDRKGLISNNDLNELRSEINENLDKSIKEKTDELKAYIEDFQAINLGFV